MSATREKIKALLEHHCAHDPCVAFVNIDVDGDTILQYFDGLGEHGGFNLNGVKNHVEDSEITEYIESTDNHLPDCSMSGPGNVDLKLTEPLTVFEIAEEIDQFLRLAGMSVEDVSFAVELRCPDENRVTWEDVGSESSGEVDEQPVSNSEEKVREVYAHFQEIDTEANGLPDPFPKAWFYIDGEKLPYVICPGVHSFPMGTDEQQEAFAQFIEQTDNCSITAEPASASQYDWSAENGYDLTERVFQELLNHSLDEVTHVQIIAGSETYDWAEIEEQQP